MQEGRKVGRKEDCEGQKIVKDGRKEGMQECRKEGRKASTFLKPNS
jgi:hypothetical protein